MCCCGRPTINGELNAYSWDGKTYSTRPVAPPSLADGDSLIYDEPGRCGGLDCHSHHFRLVKGRYGYALLVRHGGGDERIGLGVVARYAIPSFEPMDSNARFWLLHTLYSTHCDASNAARDKRDSIWRQAAAEKRIRTRRQPSRGTVKVWIEDKHPPRFAEPVQLIEGEHGGTGNPHLDKLLSQRPSERRM